MATLKTEIFKKPFTTAPQEVSRQISALCRDLSPEHEPVWVAVTPEPDAIAGECFNNVAAKVARDGGVLRSGWLIWEWRRVFIEAEHHAVWERDGELLDITPHLGGQRRVLFLPDPGRVYDFAGKKRLINVKRSLGEFAAANRWIAASNELQRTMEENSIGNIIRMDRAELTALWQAARNAQAQLLVDLAGTTRVNDPCICSSGKKFKKCCAPLIDLTNRG